MDRMEKCMDSLQEAFIHPLEPCNALFRMDALYLMSFGQLN